MPNDPALAAHRRVVRLGAVSGLIAAALILADLVTMAATPSVSSPPGEIVGHLRDHRILMLSMSYAGALAAVALVPFLASFNAYIDRHRPEDRWRWAVAAVSGGAAIAVLVVGSALRAGAAVLAYERADSNTAAAVFDLAKISISFALVPLAAFVLSASRLMSTTRLVVRWAIAIGPVVALLCVLSGMLVFVDDAVFGPGETYVGFVGVLFALWIAGSTIAMLEGDSPRAGSLRK